MAFIGNTNTTQAFTSAIDYFSGNGSTTAFTLSRPVASVAQVQVTIDNVAQNPSSAYTVSGSTITFTSAPLSGTNNIYVYYTSPITQVIAPGQGTVNTTALGNITNIASGNSSLTLQTGSSNTTAVTVDTSQNVGIGTATPSSFYSEARNLVVGAGTGGQGMTIYAGTASQSRLMFANGTAGSQAYNGFVQYDHSSNTLQFGTNGGSERMRIDSSGNVGIGTSSPTTATDIVRSNTSGNDNQMPNLFVRNTSATQGNGSSTFNQAAVSVSAGNSTVSGGIRAAYDSAGSYGTGVQFYVNSTNPLQFYSNGSERMRIDSSGNLLMSTARSSARGLVDIPTVGGSSSVCLGISRGGDAGTMVNFYSTNSSTTVIGSIGNSGNTNTTYNTSSDYRLKDEVTPMSGALNKVSALRPVTWKWKSTGADGQGFVAHELAEVIPDCVTGEKDAVDADGNPVYQGVDTSYLVATLTKAIQELKAINDTQAETINALTARIEALENR